MLHEPLDQRRIHLRDDDRQPRHASSPHQPRVGHELLRSIVGVGDHHLETLLVGVFLQGLEDVEEEGVLQVGDDEAQGAAATAGERPRVDVRVVVELVDRLEDAGARGFLHAAGVVEHPGDGRRRDLRALGDFLESHSLRCSRRSYSRLRAEAIMKALARIPQRDEALDQSIQAPSSICINCLVSSVTIPQNPVDAARVLGWCLVSAFGAWHSAFGGQQASGEPQANDSRA